MLEALGGVAVAGVIAFAYWRIASGVSTGDFMGFVTALLMAPSRSARARQPVGQGAGRARRRAERLCPARREAAHRRPPRRPPARRRPAPSVRERLLRLCGRRGTPAIANFELECRAANGGPRRPLGGGQVDRHQSRAAALRRRRRAHPHRRPGPARRHARLAARRHRDRQPGRDAVRRHDRRQHCARAPRARSEEIVAAARAAAAHEFILAQRDGYATEIGDRGLRLSGGQRQSRWRAPSSRTRRSCCSTRRRARSIPNRSGSCRRRSPASRATARRSSSPHRLDGAERRSHLRHGRGRIVELGTHAALMGREGPTHGSCARR